MSKTTKWQDLDTQTDPQESDELLTKRGSEMEKPATVGDVVGARVPDPSGEPDGRVLSVDGGAATFGATDRVLIQWAEAEAYEPTSITRDSDGVVEEATVKWPDGSAGTFTTTEKNEDFLAVDAYEITHEGAGRKVVQAEVTRDADGNVTEKPELTVEATE